MGYVLPPMPPEVAEELRLNAIQRREEHERQFIQDIAYILSLEPWMPKYLLGEFNDVLQPNTGLKS